jgi:hypothetical protein
MPPSTSYRLGRLIGGVPRVWLYASSLEFRQALRDVFVTVPIAPSAVAGSHGKLEGDTSLSDLKCSAVPIAKRARREGLVFLLIICGTSERIAKAA